MDDKVAARKALLEQELDRYVQILKTEEDPDKVIVFGSLATGQVHEWSDIDLVVVKQTTLPYLERLCKTQSLLRPQVGTDILYYTPDEFETLCLQRPFFQEEIIDKGTVVYERRSE
ncbi:MAG: nucleotidyltransferase domain-containing protein [Chloroflexota bacterium]|nr:nucleotidyltransferase domain-containing protein [Chloroflexota bacterium]